MPAYIFIKTKVTDGEQYMKYVEAAQPLAAKYGRRFLVAEPARLHVWFARLTGSMAERLLACVRMAVG
jgi:uncharacterized protein (DUF1330 family)